MQPSLWIIVCLSLDWGLILKKKKKGQIHEFWLCLLISTNISFFQAWYSNMVWRKDCCWDIDATDASSSPCWLDITKLLLPVLAAGCCYWWSEHMVWAVFIFMVSIPYHSVWSEKQQNLCYFINGCKWFQPLQNRHLGGWTHADVWKLYPVNSWGGKKSGNLLHNCETNLVKRKREDAGFLCYHAKITWPKKKKEKKKK